MHNRLCGKPAASEIFPATLVLRNWSQIWEVWQISINPHAPSLQVFMENSQISQLWLQFPKTSDILKMKFYQDLWKDSWYDHKKLLWSAELSPRVRCAFGNVWYNLVKAALWAARPSKIVGQGYSQVGYVANTGPQLTSFGAKTLCEEHGVPTDLLDV